MRKLNVPAALFIGVVVSFTGAFAVAAAKLAAHESGGFDALLRWLMFDAGTEVAGALLIAVGLFGVADRLSGTARVLVLIAAWSHGGVAAWYVAQPLIGAISHDDGVAEKVSYAYRALELVAFAGLIGLSIAARAWTRPGVVTVLAILGLVAKLFGSWAPYLGPWINDHVWDGAAAVQLAWLVRNAALVVGLIAMVHGALVGAPPPIADARRAMRGFRLAARSLLARVLAAIALALLGVGMLTHPGSIKMMMVIAPTVVIVSTLAFCIGLLLVDRANLDGMPRVRLLLGVVAVAWAVGSDLWRVEDSDFSSGTAWTIAAPLISLAGTALIVSAIQSFAVFRQNPHLRRTVSSRATLFFTMMGVSVFMPLVVGIMTSSPSSLVVLIVLAAACGIIAIVSLAGMLSLVADALSDAPQLPEARLRS